jgi:hypothetical protein
MKNSKPRLTIAQSIDNALFAKQIRALQTELKNYRVNTDNWLNCNALITYLIAKNIEPSLYN